LSASAGTSWKVVDSDAIPGRFSVSRFARAFEIAELEKFLPQFSPRTKWGHLLLVPFLELTRRFPKGSLSHILSGQNANVLLFRSLWQLFLPNLPSRGAGALWPPRCCRRRRSGRSTRHGDAA
jgi:hypothetical protein